MLGLSTRNYGTVVREFAESYGIEKSAVSEHFIRVSRRKVRELLERDLSEFEICAIYIDGGRQRALEQLHCELQELNPSAACSLGEGLDETLTVNQLPLEGWLRQMSATTNPIESTFSVVGTICRRVQCWQRGDHLQRWVGSALWVAEGNFRRIKGYRNLAKLRAALDNLPP